MFKQINILILLATALFANEYKVSHKCTLQNCTKELQSIINSQKYNKILFPKGNFLLSALKLKSNLILEGKGKDKTILVFIKSKERSLINIEGENNIIIQKLQIKNFSEKSIINIYGKIKKSSNITILNNKIINYVAKDSIELQFDVDNIKIINNQMFYKTDIAIKRNWKQISHIKYRGRVSNNKSNFRLIIKDNYLEKGNCGFRIVTKGLPLSNIIFKNNHLNKQNSAGVSFYHGRDVVIEGNLFENITAVKMKNNDSGVVWLDRYRNGKIIFKNNIIKNCKGNAIFVEELKNSKIINNKIINISKKYKKKSENSQDGNGILLTNLQNIEIKSNLFQNIENVSILIDSKLGVPHNKIVKKVYLNNNIFKNSKKLLKIDKKTKIYEDKK